MLVLSRKTGERIHIGDNIFIEVRRVAGNRVTIAIDAPKSIRILRGELMKKVAESIEEPPLDKTPVKAPVTVQNMETYVVAHRQMDAQDTTMPYSI